MNSTDHIVQVFRSDAPLLAAVSRYLLEGLSAGETCVLCATPEHQASVEEYLVRAGLNPTALTWEYRYVPLDAERTLARFYDADNGLDRTRFHRTCDLLLRQAAARGQPVRLWGEMVDLLLARGQPDAAIELEELWNEASRHHTFAMFCTYHKSAFTEDRRYRRLLHGVHTHVLTEGT